MTDRRRLSGRRVGWCVLACAGVVLVGWYTMGGAHMRGVSAAASDAAAPPELTLQLRSFAVGTSARLEVEPTQNGGRVHLSASNLPPPSAVAPGAHVYVAWATGGRILRLGEVRRDGRGNGTLDYTHPAPFDRYSLIVTAEQSAATDHPGGAPVFSSRANELGPVFPTPARPRPPVNSSSARAGERRPRPVVRRNRSPHNGGNFFTNVETALATTEAARDLTLVGTRGAAQRARGHARVAAQNGTAYVRARFRRVPPPARFGANRFVLWATNPDGRSLYLGSLPRSGLNRNETYVRAEGMDAEQFDLTVTAERGRLVRGTRRVLGTVRAQRVYTRPRRVRPD